MYVILYSPNNECTRGHERKRRNEPNYCLFVFLVSCVFAFLVFAYHKVVPFRQPPRLKNSSSLLPHIIHIVEVHTRVRARRFNLSNAYRTDNAVASSKRSGLVWRSDRPRRSNVLRSVVILLMLYHYWSLMLVVAVTAVSLYL